MFGIVLGAVVQMHLYCSLLLKKSRKLRGLPRVLKINFRKSIQGVQATSYHQHCSFQALLLSQT